MTLFSFAVPLAHLRDFEPYQDFTFGLSFLLEVPEYETYFTRKCAEGGLTYLDNSFNETLIPATPKGMAFLWQKYQPTAVVSPDADDWTLEETYLAFMELAKYIRTENILGIFRTDLERAFFKKWSKGPTAVSYWWVDLISQVDLDHVHFLGLSNLELVIKHHPPTLDTSQMVKMALKEQRFEDWAPKGILQKHLTRETGAKVGQRLQRAWDFFNWKMTDTQLELAVHNMQALKEYVNSRQVQSGPRELGYQGTHQSLPPVGLAP